MSELVVITFDDPHQADRLLDALKELERDGLLILADTAAVVRDAAGRVSYRTTHELPGAGAGAFMGGLWGLLIGGILSAPLLGVAGGAALGALGGAAGKAGLEESFRQDVDDQLRPNTSMLFLRAADVARGDEILRRLRAEQFGGKVLRSDLSDETERALQEALSAGGPQP